MKKTKFSYYLCLVDDDIIDNEYIYDNVDQFTTKSFNTLIDLGIRFINDFPSDATVTYTNSLDSDVIKNNDINILIGDFLLMYEEDDVDIYEETLTNNFEILKNEFLIFKKNRKTNKFSVVGLDELDCVYNDIMSKIADINTDKMVNFDSVFEDFVNTLQMLTTREYSIITASSDTKSYSASIIRDNTTMFNTIKAENPNYNGTPSDAGFHFENGIENLYKFLALSLITNNVVGVAFSVHESEPDVKPENSYFKKYGFIFIPNGNEIKMDRLTANEVMESYTYNSQTNTSIKPSPKFIFCGYDVNDIIYGFNL